jgi:hypothetical protein
MEGNHLRVRCQRYSSGSAVLDCQFLCKVVASAQRRVKGASRCGRVPRFKRARMMLCSVVAVRKKSPDAQRRRTAEGRKQVTVSWEIEFPALGRHSRTSFWEAHDHER